MALTIFWLEKGILLLGILCLMTGILQYGRRSHDWKGVITMFYKRVPLSVTEFKWYRSGIAFVLVAVVLKVLLFTLWPHQVV
ncbi:hypothetical protein [Vibrio porteresiae]|uniref:Uncharacterized protein n=1 Tax=Vibrio porteresiae DSM 19223 TaxID=1123496 RepID=A0ABZ0QKK9_9VIBR|nr:hypothetical protein [Vibrio porteresiae]WPC76581.1 hypothetical protein R8Z52_18805 [Vibrio porteresiae DSM 19223]